MGAYIAFFVSFLAALCISGLCSVAESVLLSLTSAQIEEIRGRNPKIGEIWAKFKEDLSAPITSILAINTTAHTVGASVAGAAFANIFGDGWLWVFSLVFTFLMLQYTEILPKTLGVRYNMQCARWVARPLDFATRRGAWIIRLIQAFNRPFEGNAEKTAKTGDDFAKEIG
ncbi:MAG: DUF21 domain-containing protein, partial [Thermoguttaceae bacterium]|nr:DUF21 domain-containing protein [Thermoguttaceae bacterium]